MRDERECDRDQDHDRDAGDPCDDEVRELPREREDGLAFGHDHDQAARGIEHPQRRDEGRDLDHAR